MLSNDFNAEEHVASVSIEDRGELKGCLIYIAVDTVSQDSTGRDDDVWVRHEDVFHDFQIFRMEMKIIVHEDD
jgi:hypothetical protein